MRLRQGERFIRKERDGKIKEVGESVSVREERKKKTKTRKKRTKN